MNTEDLAELQRLASWATTLPVFPDHPAHDRLRRLARLAGLAANCLAGTAAAEGPQPDDELTVSQVSVLTGLDTIYIRRRIHAGILPATCRDRRWWITRADAARLTTRTRAA